MPQPRSPERIIEDQVNLWSRHRAPSLGKTSYRPVITLSRAFGARGAVVGRRLGERAGFTVWDRDIVRAVADQAGADERLMETLDERRRHAVDDAVRGFLPGVDATNVQYFRALLRVLRTIAAHGDAVVVGRGANYVLLPDQALRIRVTAPVSWRIQDYSARTGCSEAIARDRVRSSDAERADFVSHYFHRDINDAADYDLVLNAATFDLDGLVDLIEVTYEKRFSRKFASGA